MLGNKKTFQTLNIKLYVFVLQLILNKLRLLTFDNDSLVFVSVILLFRDDLLSKKVR